MNRRQALRVLTSGAVAGIAGCYDSLPLSNNETPTPTDNAPGDPGDDDDGTPTPSTPTATPTPTPRPGPLPPEEATYVVAQDGSGDYDSLSKALQVTQSGDVLRLKPGKYTWAPKVNVSGTSFDSFGQKLTFIGDEPSNTKLTIAADNVKKNKVAAAIRPPEFYNLHLLTASKVTFGTVYGGDNRGGIHRSRVSGSLVGNFKAYHTTFNGSLSVTGATLTKCLVNASLRFGDHFIAEQTVFNSTVLSGQGGDGSGYFGNCVLNKGVAAPEQHNETNPVIENCTVKPMSDNIAFDLKRPVDSDKVLVMHPEVRRSKIQGRIRNSGGTWIANKFTTGGTSFDYFVADSDEIGKHPGGLQPDDDGNMVMWGNVFEGADVKFGGGDVSMYNKEKQIGNYYSEWGGGEDEDGDGVSDLPRPIPGSGDVVDQYPLMEADRKEYGLLSSEK